MKDKKTLSDKLNKELTEWACNDKYRLPLNYGDIINELVRGFINDRINDVEDCVIIKVKDIPEHMAGLDLTWLDKEIGRIKDKLLNRLKQGAGEELINYSPEYNYGSNPFNRRAEDTQKGLKVIDGTPTAISNYLSEREKKGCAECDGTGFTNVGGISYPCPACSGEVKPIILDDNELSIMKYAEEYPENWKKICKALDKSEEKQC